MLTDRQAERRVPLITRRARMRIIATVVLVASILLLRNLIGTASDLTGHDLPSKPSVTARR